MGLISLSVDRPASMMKFWNKLVNMKYAKHEPYLSIGLPIEPKSLAMLEK